MYGGQRRRVAVTGASGMIGTALGALLARDGHEIVPLVRRAARPGEIAWDPERGLLDAGALDGIDAVVHLAGETIAGSRWTRAHRQRIRESRTRGTALLASALAGLHRKPAVLVSASAVGIYGDRGDERLDERSPPGQGFLPEVAQAWEDAANPAAAAGIRVAHPRFGIVLSTAGGGLAKMLPVFRMGLGARLGSGTQWMPVVSIADAVGAIRHALATASFAGPYNVSVPEPVTNADFTRALAHALHRPALFAVPAPVLRLMFGRMADAALLASARVEPAALVRSGYVFQHPTVKTALDYVLGPR